jgi:glutathione S-transferase
VALYSATNLEKAEVDHWLEFSLVSLSQQQNADISSSLARLDAVLGPRTYLVGYDLTLADLAVYSSLRGERFLYMYEFASIFYCTILALFSQVDTCHGLGIHRVSMTCPNKIII